MHNILLPSGKFPVQVDAVTATESLVTVPIGGDDVDTISTLFDLSCQNMAAAAGSGW